MVFFGSCERERLVADLLSFFPNVWDTKECEKEGMMMLL